MPLKQPRKIYLCAQFHVIHSNISTSFGGDPEREWDGGWDGLKVFQKTKINGGGGGGREGVGYLKTHQAKPSLRPRPRPPRASEASWSPKHLAAHRGAPVV